MSEKPFFPVVTQSAFYQIKVPLSKTKVLWVALALACMLLFGDAYAFDNPMALQSTIQSQMGLDNLQFNMLYSIYSLPNIILPFFGGMLIDKIGVRISIVIFSLVIILGQSIVVIGGYTFAYITMLSGRGIFGMGSESLNAAQASIMSQWFKGGQVSLALGLCLSVPKLGSALNSFISPMIQARYDSLGFTLLIGLFILIFSFGCGLVLIVLDKINQERLNKYIEFNQQITEKKQKQIIQTEQQLTDISNISQKEFQEFDLQAALLNESAQEQMEEEYEDGPAMSIYSEEMVEEIKFSDLQALSGSYWILATIIMLSEALIVPFLDNGNQFVQVSFGFSPEAAGSLLTIPYVFAAVITPLVGIYSDRVRYRSILILATCTVFIITHLLLLTISCEDACYVAVIPLFFLGLCFSMYSAILVPTIPMVVKSQMIGTAFGLVGVLQNTALALFPMITGHIFNSHLLNELGQPDPRQGYQYQSYFFVGVSFINLIIAIALFLFDRNGTRRLSKQ